MRAEFFRDMTELLDALVQSREGRDLRAVVSRIAKTARERLRAHTCVICAMNPVNKQVIEPLIIFPQQEDNDGYHALCSERLVQEILARDIILVPDLEQPGALEPALAAALQQLSGACAIVALPLRIRGQRRKSFGILYLIYHHAPSFRADDAELFQIFADQISVILEGVWLEQRYREVALIGQEINHELSDIDTLFGKLRSHIGDILDANYALLLAIYQPQSGTLDVYQAEEGKLVSHLGHKLEGACQYVIETRQPLFIAHRSAEELPFRIAMIPGTKPEESFIYVPLMLRGEALGVLSIQHPQPDTYTRADQFILELLANHVALALYNTRLYSSLSQLYETGQILTQQFESASTLQTIVDNIRAATRSDLVVLYPYSMAARKFVGPPYFAGQLLHPMPQGAMYPVTPDNMALLMLEQRDAIFEKESETLYTSRLDGASLRHHQRFYQREQVRSTAAIPLRVGEKAVGVLFVNFRQPQHFDAAKRLLIEGLAHYAAIAIKNAQTFERLSERRIHELETLQKIDSALNTPDPALKELLDAILTLADERIPSDHSSILLYNAQKRLYTSYAIHGSHASLRTVRQLANRVDRGLIRWVVEHKQTALVNNVHCELPWRDIYLQADDATTSELDVPLLDEDRVIGVFNFESATEEAFHEEDALFLETLAGQAVLAIKKAQAYEREKRHAERFRLLYEAGRELAKITRSEQIDIAYRTVIRLAQELSHSPVVIRSFDEEAQELVLACCSQYRHSPPSTRIKISEKLNGQVARELRTLVIHDVEELPAASRPGDPTIRSVLITPITFKNRYYGNLELTHESVAHFQNKDQEFFEGLAQQLASTLYRLEITQERQELEQRALAAETMISIGQAAYEITHRVGNDLGLVGSCVSHIQEHLQSLNVDNAVVCEKLHYIEKAVNKVLDLSESLKSELGNWKDNDRFVLLPPQVLLEEAWRAVPMPDSIAVRLEVAGDVAPVCVIQPLMADTLINLIINAKEAMPDGGLLTLRASNRGRSVALEIIDTGIGIPEENQVHIFDLLFSTKKHGSGFGLWSARRNTLKNRGKLEVSSEPDKGTTFTLLLPRAEEKIL